jgi:hypothetical protein
VTRLGLDLNENLNGFDRDVLREASMNHPRFSEKRKAPKHLPIDSSMLVKDLAVRLKASFIHALDIDRKCRFCDSGRHFLFVATFGGEKGTRLDFAT